MDFPTARGPQPQTVAPATHSAGGSSKKLKDRGEWTKITNLVLVGAVVVLLVALVAFLVFGGNSSANGEDKYVDTSKLQAVFLNTGQVYFGNVKTLNSSYFVLTNIYYLQTSGTGASNSNTSVSLVKLGCELHEPFDQMVINRSQVTFWENLQDGGQVAKAVKTFEQQNPNGQKCSDQSASAPTNSSSVQNAPTSNSNSKP